jgi:hypothetical protein
MVFLPRLHTQLSAVANLIDTHRFWYFRMCQLQHAEQPYERKFGCILRHGFRSTAFCLLRTHIVELPTKARNIRLSLHSICSRRSVG